jgi:hypothetical protein
MRRLFLIAGAAVALSACGGKGEVAENGSLAENLSFESKPANDASALEAVEAEGSRLAAAYAANEVEADNSAESNAVKNAPAKADNSNAEANAADTNAAGNSN